jgi:hypothetical protein
MSHDGTPNDTSNPAVTDQDSALPAAVDIDPGRPDLTEAFAALAQRIVEGHQDGAAVVGQLTIVVFVRVDPDSDPADTNPDAYAYTREAIAAFGRGDWSFTTITLQISTPAVQGHARQNRVDHGLAAPDDERDFLAGSLLPDLFTEVTSSLRATLDAIESTEQAGRSRVIPRTIPSAVTDENYPVIAWIPTFDGSNAVAIGHREQPEYDHCPYVVGILRPDPSAPGQYLVAEGPYEAEDLGAAVLEAIAAVESAGDSSSVEFDKADGDRC